MLPVTIKHFSQVKGRNGLGWWDPVRWHTNEPRWDTVRTPEDVGHTVASTRIPPEKIWVPGRYAAHLCVVSSLLKEEFQLNRCSYLDLQYHLLFSPKVRMKKTHPLPTAITRFGSRGRLLKNLTPASDCSSLAGLSVKPVRIGMASEYPGESYSSKEKRA